MINLQDLPFNLPAFRLKEILWLVKLLKSNLMSMLRVLKLNLPQWPNAKTMLTFGPNGPVALAMFGMTEEHFCFHLNEHSNFSSKFDHDERVNDPCP